MYFWSSLAWKVQQDKIQVTWVVSVLLSQSIFRFKNAYVLNKYSSDSDLALLDLDVQAHSRLSFNTSLGMEDHLPLHTQTRKSSVFLEAMTVNSREAGYDELKRYKRGIEVNRR